MHERIHDTYKTKRKLPEPTVCPICYAVFQEGHWQWVNSWPIDAQRHTCQACHRAPGQLPCRNNHYHRRLRVSHAVEVLNLARHQEQQSTLPKFHDEVLDICAFHPSREYSAMGAKNDTLSVATLFFRRRLA
jgi:hypothetical protein